VDAPCLESRFMNAANFQPKSPLRFVFRLDAGSPIGNGHLMRSMVLALELLDRGHQVVLLAKQMPQSLQALLRSKGIALHVIAFQSDGLGELASIHQEYPIDWLVIDHYGIDAQWERAARPYALHIMVIDDLANRQHDCDLLLDQNIPNQLQSRYPDLLPKHCQFAIGWTYLLARPEFYVRDRIARAGTLIFLGGGDHSESLTALIEHLRTQTELHPLKILVSSDYLPVTHWQKIVGNCGQVFCDLPNPAYLYRSAKVALVRCGFVSYELTLMGIPTVHVHTSAVQRQVAQALEQLEAGLALPEEHLSDVDKLIDVLHRAAVMSPVPVNEKLSPGASMVANLLEHFDEYK
jgi:UDP-2,4-diacetamido-2,4,6-trideoxy-beta-L-altropyranose hydrolase